VALLLPDAILQLYLPRGWAVFPCRDKKPLTAHGFKDATLDAEQIVKWWKTWPDAQPAIPTGAVTRLIIPESDGPQGHEWASRQSDWPPTFTVQTSSPDNLHFYFRLPEGFKTKCSARLIAPQVDVRADGGYVIGPLAIHHKTRRPYTPLSWTTPIADAPGRR
jgi:hypothetical protein